MTGSSLSSPEIPFQSLQGIIRQRGLTGGPSGGLSHFTDTQRHTSPIGQTNGARWTGDRLPTWVLVAIIVWFVSSALFLFALGIKFQLIQL